MATDLTFGSVPALYREVYDIFCPNYQDHVDQDMFTSMLVKASLPTSILSQIWEAVDNRQGFLTRNGLYKALALTALAQQGKTINDKILQTFTDQELPKPQLGDLSELRTMSIRIRRERTPNVLGYNYEELCALDTVQVQLVPEKKGIILKHVEYEVTSSRYKSTVLRRYSDFVCFLELLLFRYPYRMVPGLPPKKIGADRLFIEQRRRALRRFLNLTVRHPIFCDDKIVKFFLTFNGSEFQHRMKEQFRGEPDEFMTSEVALKAKELVPLDTQQQFSHSREHVRILLNSIMKLRDISERMVHRSTTYATDMLLLGKELSVLGKDTTPLTSWSCGQCDTWSQLKKGFKRISVEYTSLSDKASCQAANEEEDVVERLNNFLGILFSYRDLCERHEKGVLQDHQRALSKLGQYKKRKMSATVQGQSEFGPVEQLEQRILEQESRISNMENRNFFSLHCVQMETQLIHANLEAVYIAMKCMISQEATAHTELGHAWDVLKPVINAILGGDTRNGSASPTLQTQSSTLSNSGQHSYRSTTSTTPTTENHKSSKEAHGIHV